jgi:hypothetical protein
MLHGNVRLPVAALTADTRFVRTETTDLNFCVWSVPPRMPAGEPVPTWLLELATAVCGKIVDDAGQLTDTANPALTLDGVRRALATMPASAPLAEWGRWILDDRAERPIAPGFTATAADAEHLARLLAAPSGPGSANTSNSTAP